MKTAPIGPKTVTVLGYHWRAGPKWEGFDFSRAEIRSGSIWRDDDYHLGVPWMHPDDIIRHGRRDPFYEVIYRLRLKRGWRSFVMVAGEWLISTAPPTEVAPFGTPWHRQISAIIDVEIQ